MFPINTSIISLPQVVVGFCFERKTRIQLSRSGDSLAHLIRYPLAKAVIDLSCGAHALDLLANFTFHYRDVTSLVTTRAFTHWLRIV